MDLGSYLIQIRNERGYTQKDLADHSGVSPAEVSRVESGKRQHPAPSVLKAFARTLAVDYHYLMQLAGYIEAETDEAPRQPQVFQNEETGVIVDGATGAEEMIRADQAWANVAFLVSRELSESDREHLTDIAMSFLKRNKST